MTILRKWISISIVLIGLFLLYFIFLQHQVSVLHELVLRDPLFYSPDVTTNELRASVSRLAKTEAETRQIMGQQANATTTLTKDEQVVLDEISTSNILPITYLRSLPDAIDTTKQFIDHPTFLNAFHMQQTNATVAAAYSHDALSLQTLMRNAASSTPYIITLQLFGMKTSVSTILNDISLVVTNGDALKRQTASRTRCLFFGLCPSPKPFVMNDVLQPPASFPVALPDAVINIGYENMKRSGPYAVESSCFESKYNSMYLFSNETYALPKLNDNIFFSDFEYLDKNNAYALAFLNNGVRYDDQPEANDYRCANLEYWGDISTIDYLNKKGGHPEITSSYGLAKSYQNGSLNQTEQRVVENKMIGLPLQLGTIEKNLSLFNFITENFQGLGPSVFLIGVRSNYSLTYGSFSRSIWRLNEKPQYATEVNIPPTSAYAQYTDLVKHYTEEEMANFRRNSRTFLESHLPKNQ